MIEATSQSAGGFDPHLLSIEELFRKRRPERATRELELVADSTFAQDSLSEGLLLSLKAEAALFRAQYTQAIELGSESWKKLAPSSQHRRVGRVLWTLAKAYSLIGDLTNADMKARDAISAYRRAEHRPGVVNCLNELAKVAYTRSEYRRAAEFVQDALALIDDDPARVSQLKGNLGRIRILTGKFEEAESLLQTALDYDLQNDQELSAARNYLSLGYLRYRQWRFSEAASFFDKASGYIERNGMARERLNLEEYRGELAFEKGDYRGARTILQKALQESEKLAPGSALVTQIGRRLAETHFALGEESRAMEIAHRSLEKSEKLGERVEIGLCNVIVGVMLARSSNRNDSIIESRSYYLRGIDALRQVGDPYELGRALMLADEVYTEPGSTIAYDLLNEARNLLSELGVERHIANSSLILAERYFRDGAYGDGLAPLREARARFREIGEDAAVRKIENLLQSVSSQAVAVSLSSANSFNLFGGFAARDAALNGDGDVRKALEALREKTRATRAVIIVAADDSAGSFYTDGFNESTLPKFRENFWKLAGEEISREKPTLLIDTTRDPYLSDLSPSALLTVASVIVVPLRMSGDVSGYLYLDRLTSSATSVERPFSQEELNFSVGFADFVALQLAQEQKARLVEDNRRLKEQMQKKVGFPTIITQNAEMVSLLARVRQVVDSDISVSITGETGCGKDLLAKAIHYNSIRRDKRFISVNCAALPETLLESELFGYKRGAFTGADRDKSGLLEEADGGTFFLDEIGDMPLSVQAKLLRVLEEKEVVRLGDSVPRKIDVRIISATHKDLLQAMERGDFRQDLYYRLSALTFRLPSLRERREDIPLLIEKFSAESGVTFAQDAMRALVAYDWPGNIRELENEVKKLCLVSGESKRVTREMLTPKILGSAKPVSTAPAPAAQFSLMSYDSDAHFSLYDFIAEHERRFISSALARCQGVKKHAAEMLKIPESTLRLKIKQYDIDIENFQRLH